MNNPVTSPEKAPSAHSHHMLWIIALLGLLILAFLFAIPKPAAQRNDHGSVPTASPAASQDTAPQAVPEATPPAAP